MAAWCTVLLGGIYLAGYAAIWQRRPIAVRSDFKAFAARVAGDQAAQHVLAYGGAKEATDLDFLLVRVQNLSAGRWNRVIWLGVLLPGLAIAGLFDELADVWKAGDIGKTTAK